MFAYIAPQSACAALVELCVTDRASVQPTSQSKPALTDFDLQSYSPNLSLSCSCAVNFGRHYKELKKKAKYNILHNANSVLGYRLGGQSVFSTDFLLLTYTRIFVLCVFVCSGDADAVGRCDGERAICERKADGSFVATFESRVADFFAASRTIETVGRS